MPARTLLMLLLFCTSISAESLIGEVKEWNGKTESLGTGFIPCDGQLILRTYSTEEFCKMSDEIYKDMNKGNFCFVIDLNHYITGHRSKKQFKIKVR